MAASVALQRKKQNKTAHTNNGTIFQPPPGEDLVHPGRTTLLAKALIGRKDPMARENGFNGPAAMSTTHSASYAPPPDIDPALNNANAYLDLSQAKIPFNGSVKNRALTLFHQPHDGWQPSTEFRDQYVRHDANEGDILTREIIAQKKRQPVANLRAPESAVAHTSSDNVCLTYLQEQRLKSSNPILYDTMKRQDPWSTTYQSTYDARPDATKTQLNEVVENNETAERLLGTVSDKGLLLKTLTGAPHKKHGSGFASNTSYIPQMDRAECANPTKLTARQAATCHVAKRLDNEGDLQHSVYKSDFRDQMKLPVCATEFRLLRKYTSAFDRGNRDNFFVDTPDEPDRWLRKV